jgi:FkbM family methyltransferase
MLSRLIYTCFGRRGYVRYEALRQFQRYGRRLRKDAEHDHLASFVPIGGTCLDVGANLGSYTLQLALRVGERGRVYALEPMPDTFAGLRLASRFFGVANVHLRSLAVADSPSRQRMTVPLLAGTPAHGRSHLIGSVVGSLDTRTDVEVEVTTLDAFLASEGVDHVDFVKMDVEGAELPALQGAQELVRCHRPNLLLEVDASHTEQFGYLPVDLLRYLYEAGYEQGFYCAAGTLHERRVLNDLDMGALPSHNLFFVHRSRASGLAP